jgi:beta-galactosidase
MKTFNPTQICLAMSFALAIPLSTQATTLLNVDASKQPDALKTGHFNMGTAVAPDGSKLESNNRFLLKDGKPWIPVMGEFHYTRFPKEYWEEEILKMKSAGVDVIATYVFWNHHEEVPGQFKWSGDHDLRAFTALIAKHKMKMFLRIGPWAHGEARFGGTPDWIVNQMPSRRNDPTYLIYVERFWADIAKQVSGYMWKDGGPIIGTQLENEYNLAGPGMGAEHISVLKKLAVKLGFDTPFYTVTGWDGAIYPRGEVVPVFGGYPDEPWGKDTTKMKPNEVYTFRFNSRVAGDAGAQTPATTRGTAVEDLNHTPFLGAEFGPGVPIMYRRRPMMQPDDIGAMLPVQLGSGVNLYGYYMFHGGRNPKAQGSNIEESALLGAWNDCPMINYDFQAPFGQYGQRHAVLNKILPYHNFLESFGDRLAPMIVHGPEVEPKNRMDLKTARFSVRSSGDSGFVFMSNHVRQYPMDEQKGIRFAVKLADKTLTFPSQDINVATGAYFIWPFNFDMDGVNLAWASAQPLARIDSAKDEVTYVFMAENGIAPELAITAKADQTLKTKSGKLTKQDGLNLITGIKPGNGEVAVITSGDKTIRVVVMSRAQGEQVYMGNLGGQNSLVSSAHDVIFTEAGLELHTKTSNEFKVGIFPALATAPSADLKLSSGKDGIFQSYSAKAKPKVITATLTKTREAQQVSPLLIGGPAKAALQPFPEQYGKSAAWHISIPKDAVDGLNDVYMNIDYQGDIGRLFSGVIMLDDSYYSGHTWEIGLKRFTKEIETPLTLTVLPLRKDAPIYIDEAVKAKLPNTEQVAEVLSVKLLPEYKLSLKVN